MSQAVPTELDNLSIMSLKVYNYSLVAIGAHSERLCEISIDRSKKRVRSVRCHFTLFAPFLRRRRVTYHLQSHLLCMQRGRRIETRAGTITHVTKCTTGTRNVRPTWHMQQTGARFFDTGTTSAVRSDLLRRSRARP